MENLIQWWTQSRRLIPNSGNSFRFSERTREGSPLLPNCVPVSVVEYASISLNMPKYRWKCLNKLFWLCQGSKHAWWSYMFDRVLKMALLLNKPGLWIWHSCISKGYLEFQICLILAPYASIMPEYASLCLDMAEYCWISLNIHENAWINLSDYVRVLNMAWYSYNIIIIVTNVIILEFLSARFGYPGNMLPFYLFLTWVRT